MPTAQQITISLKGAPKTTLDLFEEFLSIQLANFSLGKRSGKLVNVLTLAKTIRDLQLDIKIESFPNDIT